MLIGVLIREECEIHTSTTRLVNFKLEQSILKIFKFSITGDYRTMEQGRTTNSFFFYFFPEKMVQSAAIKQGRSANRKHTYFFWP